MPVSKKSEANDTTGKTINGRIGRRTKHFLVYISNVKDVIDNVLIHAPVKIHKLEKYETTSTCIFRHIGLLELY
jgi:hypothetical protein